MEIKDAVSKEVNLTDLKLDEQKITENVEKQKMYDTIRLKSDIFDIIRQQEQIMNEFNKLNEIKLNKIQQLQKLE